MATIKYNGKSIPVAENSRVKEMIEAENALGIDAATAKAAAKSALGLYITIRRADPDIPIDALTNLVLNFDMVELMAGDDDEDETEPGESPLGANTETADEEPDSSETNVRPTIGPLPLASSG